MRVSTTCIMYIIDYYMLGIGSEVIVNIKAEILNFDFEAHILIGWLSHSICWPANQNLFLKVKHFCFYVKVAYHFLPEYSVILIADGIVHIVFVFCNPEVMNFKLSDLLSY